MNNIRVLGASLFAVGTLALSATSAVAAPPTAGSCSLGDVTAGPFGSRVNATACQGAFEGNDTGNQGQLLPDLNGGLFSNLVGNVTWSLLGKSDEGGSGVTVSSNSTSGTWSVLPKIDGPFVISLKAGNFYSAYLFNNISDISEGAFNTQGVAVNQNGNAQGLSHLSIFVADSDNHVDVPEPATLAALGMVAVGGLGALKKKKA